MVVRSSAAGPVAPDHDMGLLDIRRAVSPATLRSSWGRARATVARRLSTVAELLCHTLICLMSCFLGRPILERRPNGEPSTLELRPPIQNRRE